MSKTIEKKEKTSNEIARTFFWTSFLPMFFIVSVSFIFIIQSLIAGIWLFFLEFSLSSGGTIIMLLGFLCFMLFARHKIKKTTIVKKSQIKSISLNLLLRFSILAFICGFADYLNSISGPPYGLLVYEIFIFTTCATVFLITISEKD